MQTYVDELLKQSTDAGMIVNARKSKEMLIGAAILKDPPPLLMLSHALIDRVVTFKLLG